MLTPDSVVMGWAQGELSVLHHVSGRMLAISADWVVLAVPGTPADGLYLDLRAAGVDVHRVGDCIAPRRVHSAVVDGQRIGTSL